jgi:hypothetical protein
LISCKVINFKIIFVFSRPQEKKKKAGKVPLPSTNWQPTVLAKEASMSGTLSESETQIETESDSSLKSKPKPRYTLSFFLSLS